MPLMISLVDIPSQGLPIEYTVDSSDIELSTEDGKILGSLSCNGHVFSTDDHLAMFHGSITGSVVRECVRCLMDYKENVSFSLDAEFKQSRQPSVVSFSSKKMKKGSRRHDSAVDNEEENEPDAYPILDNQIDLLPALREHLILAAPLQPLCQESCAGLCQVCGVNLNEGVCGCCSPVTVSSVFESNIHPILSQKTARRSSRSV